MRAAYQPLSRYVNHNDPHGRVTHHAAPQALAAVSGSSIEAGRSWRYAVVVKPPAWRDITLTYRTQREGAGRSISLRAPHRR